MKVREISVEARRSKNYNSYAVSMTATIDEHEDRTAAVMTLQTECRKLANSEIAKDSEQ